MKLGKLHLLSEELVKEFEAEAVEGKIYYRLQEDWQSLAGMPVSVDEHQRLQKSITEPIAHHATSEKNAWFYWLDFNGVVCLKFHASPNVNKRRKYRNRIDDVIQRASNAYRVAHNQLTLLLSKDEFLRRLDLSLKSLENTAPSGESMEEASRERMVALLALDIDHFKQVNDTYGHLYGDQVLKAFATRLEAVADEIRSSFLDVKIEIGHPSGEEFLVLIEGAVVAERLIEWADEFRVKILEKPLPSEEEWVRLVSAADGKTLTPPLVHDRKISTSIGIAIQQKSEQGRNDGASELLKRADIAMYRAKSGGRNRVVLFDEILASCGRVLEYDELSKIVAIDVGKNVGVSQGQEFKVFAEKFSGNSKFQISDGRTTRTAGVYPKVELTRVTVFNVQSELSFAFPSDSNFLSVIPPGAHLEALPLGSISNLSPDVTRYFPAEGDTTRVGDIAILQAFIDQAVTSGDHPFSTVFRFTGEQEYSKRFGSLALSTALTRLFRAVSSSFHSVGRIGIPDAVSVCLVGRSSSYDEAAISAFSIRIKDELPGLNLTIGVFEKKDNKEDKKKYEFDAKNAIGYARFAASEYAPKAGTLITHFSKLVAQRVITALRDNKLYRQALADFDALLALGISSPNLYNLGGLICSSLSENERSMSLYESAMLAAPSTLVFRSNFAIACYRMREVERGLEALGKLSDIDVDELKKMYPFGFVTYARLLARAQVEGLPYFSEERLRLIGRDALKVEPWGLHKESEIVNIALTAIEA